MEERNIANQIRDIIEICGRIGTEVLSGDADEETYISSLIELLDILKSATADELKAIGYPQNIESTLLMDQYLIGGTLSEEFDQLSLLSTLVTYVACNSEGSLGHSKAYMDRVTALRKIIENQYGAEAIRFCGSDGC